jgi:hypothetical protein
MRVAQTYADRLLAVVSAGDGCHYMFHPDWIAAQDQMEYPFQLMEALAWKFGYRNNETVESYSAEAMKLVNLNPTFWTEQAVNFSS